MNVWTGKYVPLASYFQGEAFVLLVLCFSPQGVLPVWEEYKEHILTVGKWVDFKFMLLQ